MKKYAKIAMVNCCIDRLANKLKNMKERVV